MCLTDFLAYANGTQHMPAQSGRVVKGRAMSASINGKYEPVINKKIRRSDEQRYELERKFSVWRQMILNLVATDEWTKREFVQCWDILEEICGVSDARMLAMASAEVRFIASVMIEAGWEKYRFRKDYTHVHAWRVPGRPQKVRGMPRRFMTIELAEEMRRFRAETGAKNISLAYKFGISESAVARIVRGETYVRKTEESQMRE